MSRISSWPGSSSTVTQRWTLSVVVDVDPLDRRRCARRAGGRARARPVAGAQAHAVAEAVVDAVDVDLPLAAQLLAAVVAAAAAAVADRRRGRAARECPPASRPRALEHRAHRRVLLGDLARARASDSASTCSSSASSISVPSKRSPRLSGASCGWSGSTIAAPSSASFVVGREHREGVDVRARHGRGGGVLGRRDRREEAGAARARATTCVEQQARAQRAGAVEPRRRTSVVLCTHVVTRTSRRAERLRGHPDAPAHRVEGEGHGRPAPPRARASVVAGSSTRRATACVALAAGSQEAHLDAERRAVVGPRRSPASGRGRTSSALPAA